MQSLPLFIFERENYTLTIDQGSNIHCHSLFENDLTSRGYLNFDLGVPEKRGVTKLSYLLFESQIR